MSAPSITNGWLLSLADVSLPIQGVSKNIDEHNTLSLILPKKSTICIKISGKVKCYHEKSMFRQKSKLTEEHKAKISKAMKGRCFSKEHRKKLSEAAKKRKSY